jgi:asparagine synthase (glutamine-hydrolysing)
VGHYNGEVFNFVEVRHELEALGVQFSTSTDTEVLLAAWERWGAASLAKLRGMWGFVLVDVRQQRAWLSRDRLGIKPLYLAERGGTLAVASEIKQLRAFGALAPDDAAVAVYLQTGAEDLRTTMFADVTALPAGTTCEVDLRTGTRRTPEPYWHPERVRAHISDPAEATQRFGEAFRESVRIHLRSDVPVGCALSGGLDSSAIAAIVAEEGRGTGARLEAFSATFPGFALDESRFIDRVVKQTGAGAHRVEPNASGLMADLDRFLWCHDEPPGSLSQYGAYAVARLTREAGVPVTLNGQGGDEVLGGYWQTTFAGLAAQRRHPRRLARTLLRALGPGGNRELFAQAPAMARRYLSRRRPDGQVPIRFKTERNAAPALRALDMSEQERRVFEVRELTLPRLLKWDDRNFMAFAVEGRYPFLDHHVIETCLSFESEALFHAGWTKEPLRRALTGRLPQDIVRRRGKIGFETPQQTWLQGALGAHVERAIAAASPVHKFVAPRDALRLMARGRARGGREAGQAVVRLFFADRWLRALGADA